MSDKKTKSYRQNLYDTTTHTAYITNALKEEVNLLIMKGSKKATQKVLHRIAEAKKKYGADNAEEYMEASKRVKSNR